MYKITIGVVSALFLQQIVNKHMTRNDLICLDFAQSVLNNGPTPRQGKKSDQAHPPIHPTKYTHGLQGLIYFIMHIT